MNGQAFVMSVTANRFESSRQATHSALASIDGSPVQAVAGDLGHLEDQKAAARRLWTFSAPANPS